MHVCMYVCMFVCMHECVYIYNYPPAPWGAFFHLLCIAGENPSLDSSYVLVALMQRLKEGWKGENERTAHKDKSATRHEEMGLCVPTARSLGCRCFEIKTMDDECVEGKNQRRRWTPNTCNGDMSSCTCRMAESLSAQIVWLKATATPVTNALITGTKHNFVLPPLVDLNPNHRKNQLNRHLRRAAPRAISCTCKASMAA